MSLTWRTADKLWTMKTIDGHGRCTVTGPAGEPERRVMMLGSGDWANLPNDRREDMHLDRVVLTDGPELPAAVLDWAMRCAGRFHRRCRARFEAMMDVEDRAFADTGW